MGAVILLKQRHNPVFPLIRNISWWPIAYRVKSKLLNKRVSTQSISNISIFNFFSSFCPSPPHVLASVNSALFSFPDPPTIFISSCLYLFVSLPGTPLLYLASYLTPCFWFYEAGGPFLLLCHGYHTYPLHSVITGCLLFYCKLVESCENVLFSFV